MRILRNAEWLSLIDQLNTLETELTQLKFDYAMASADLDIRDSSIRKLEIRVREHEYAAEEAAERIEELTAKSPLPDEDRARLRSEWPSIVCAYCGGAHQGWCNRVRVVDLDPHGRPTRIAFRDQWEPNRDVIWPEEVFESYAQQFAERDQKLNEARAKAVIEQAAETEGRNETERFRRRQSPAAIAAQVARELGPERTNPPAA